MRRNVGSFDPIDTSASAMAWECLAFNFSGISAGTSLGCG